MTARILIWEDSFLYFQYIHIQSYNPIISIASQLKNLLIRILKIRQITN